MSRTHNSKWSELRIEVFSKIRHHLYRTRKRMYTKLKLHMMDKFLANINLDNEFSVKQAIIIDSKEIKIILADKFKIKYVRD